ncbi:MAG: 2-octaprenyl-6-methoxyphenol hydroxylase [Gammaproteobacteria bacterium]|jgi:2-octaprenyl-6-methoxyphenol hydroxylase
MQPVLIAGGGPIGSVLAIALSRAGIAVTLVDSGLAGSTGGASGESATVNNGSRPIALSASSARILDTLGVWSSIAPQVCPIQMVHVREQGHFGAVRLRASEHGVPALGYVTDARVISSALSCVVSGAEHVTRIAASRVERVQVQADDVQCSLGAASASGHCARGESSSEPSTDGAGVRSAQLLVVADGGQSSLCATLGIDVDRRDYEQMAVSCTVRPERDHQGIAYERFTPQGPLAMLPIKGGDCAVVWSLSCDCAEEIAALGDAEFTQALRKAFGRRLGRFVDVGARSVFALSLVRARHLTSSRAVLIGNAANQLHPVAGQGLNLGLRDAAVLVDLIAEAVRAGQDPGADALLKTYARQRSGEQRSVVRFTDSLARGFSSGPPWFGWIRGAGLLVLDVLPGARHVLARHAMGLGGAHARLLRGLDP